MHIRKRSWLQYWLERRWNETAVFFLPPNLQCFLRILILLHCLVSLSFVCCWNWSHVFNLAPEVLTVLYQGQCSFWQAHQLLLIDPNRLWRRPFHYFFFVVVVVDESHRSVCKKSQVLFGCGHVARAVWHSLLTFTCTFIRESTNQVFFTDIQSVILLCAFFWNPFT